MKINKKWFWLATPALVTTIPLISAACSNEQKETPAENPQPATPSEPTTEISSISQSMTLPVPMLTKEIVTELQNAKTNVANFNAKFNELVLTSFNPLKRDDFEVAHIKADSAENPTRVEVQTKEFTTDFDAEDNKINEKEIITTYTLIKVPAGKFVSRRITVAGDLEALKTNLEANKNDKAKITELINQNNKSHDLIFTLVKSIEYNDVKTTFDTAANKKLNLFFNLTMQDDSTAELKLVVESI
ncbi:hypothetical protein [Mycoplasmopsis columbinasalis]|uniref:Lipoprotein n=1 Tax=Mycoplasmopsis columbinasalis TaxID=114880 RepID=A0A449BAE1_9BACT|nr:hypothetical protein [Mycoplasmopsis columbinasalis]VEU78155.1 Uncharacterised protein [Mycoplasmopsis columbinasalis]